MPIIRYMICCLGQYEGETTRNEATAQLDTIHSCQHLDVVTRYLKYRYYFCYNIQLKIFNVI